MVHITEPDIRNLPEQIYYGEDRGAKVLQSQKDQTKH